MKTGYSIKTWKMRLFCPEKQMIETTEALYREAAVSYTHLDVYKRQGYEEGTDAVVTVVDSTPTPEPTEKPKATATPTPEAAAADSLSLIHI